MTRKPLTADEKLEKITKKLLRLRRKWAKVMVNTEDFERMNDAMENVASIAVVDVLDECLGVLRVPVPADPKPSEY